MNYKEMKTKEDAILLSKKFKRNYQVVDFEKVTADNVKQILYHVANDEKIPLLLGLLKRINRKRIIVFWAVSSAG